MKFHEERSNQLLADIEVFNAREGMVKEVSEQSIWGTTKQIENVKYVRLMVRQT